MPDSDGTLLLLSVPMDSVQSWRKRRNGEVKSHDVGLWTTTRYSGPVEDLQTLSSSITISPSSQPLSDLGTAFAFYAIPRSRGGAGMPMGVLLP